MQQYVKKKLLPRITKTHSARRITRGSVCRQDIHTSSSTSIPCHCLQQNSIKVDFILTQILHLVHVLSSFLEIQNNAE